MHIKMYPENSLKKWFFVKFKKRYMKENIYVHARNLHQHSLSELKLTQLILIFITSLSWCHLERTLPLLSIGEAVCSEDFENYSIPCSCGEIASSLTIEAGAVVDTFLGNEVSTGIIPGAQRVRSVKRKLNDI